MAEHELLTLDGRIVTRCRSIRQRLERGEQLLHLLHKIVNVVIHELKRLVAICNGSGVSVRGLFDAAAGDKSLMDNLVWRVGNNDSAKLLRDVTSTVSGGDRQAVIDRFVDAVGERVLGRRFLGFTRMADRMGSRLRSTNN